MLGTCGEPEGRLGDSARRFHWVNIVCGCLIFVSIAFFQLSERAYQSNLAIHPDEAAHFVTGICVLDYFRTAFGSNPVSFAESYYVRYPKVAFGHWPPVFYVIQALWYGALGATTLNAILLVGFTTAVAALILFLRLERLHGISIALFSISGFLWLPLVRISALVVMADMLASVFALLAILAFCDGCTRGARRFWIAFALWSGIAMLTKESALYLLPFTLLALIFLKERTQLRSRMIWQIGLPTCFLVASFYAAMHVLQLRNLPDLLRVRVHVSLLKPFFRDAPIALFLMAAYGVAEVLARKKLATSSERGIHVRVALLWLVAALACQVFFREDVEDRYFLPAYFPVIMLVAEGLHLVTCAVARTLAKPVLALLIAAGVTALCIASMPAVRLSRRTGYAEVAASLPYDSTGPTILVSSDPRGEGALVVERLVRDRARSSVVLRASKVLSSSTWMSTNYKLLLHTVQDVREWLNVVPVRFIVLDMNGFISTDTRPHHRLLEDTIRSSPGQFRLVGDFPLYLSGHRRENAVQVYENLMARGRHADVIRIDMMNTLGRILEVRLRAPGRDVVAPVASSSGVLDSLLDRLPNRESASTLFGIAPKSDSVGAGVSSGQIYVTAPAGYQWSTSRVPDWITITTGEKGTGDGVVAYKVAENTSNEHRSAAITIGEATFQVTQPRSSYTSVPFFAGGSPATP